MSVRSGRTLTLALALLAASGPAFGAGFGIFEHGSKAMGMAGAFTAQADDPSLLFHNAGGPRFRRRRGAGGRSDLDQGRRGRARRARPVPG